MKFAEAKYRTCGYCHTVNVAMKVAWSTRSNPDAAGEPKPAAALICPRCARVTIVTFEISNHPAVAGDDIHPRSEVRERSSLPNADDFEISIKHLPDDVASFFFDAQRALLAGLPDAAAVQLRKTLEAAAANKGLSERTLVTSIQKMVELGYVTLAFKDVLTHIRKIGNSGAHYNSVQLTAPEVERSLRFTTQVLRNLFEVTGELEELQEEEAEATQQVSDADTHTHQDPDYRGESLSV